MKTILVLSCVLVFARCAPVSQPDDDDRKTFKTNFLSSAPKFSQVKYSVPTHYSVPVGYAAGPVTFVAKKTESHEIESKPVTDFKVRQFPVPSITAYSVQQATGPTVATYEVARVATPYALQAVASPFTAVQAIASPYTAHFTAENTPIVPVAHQAEVFLPAAVPAANPVSYQVAEPVVVQQPTLIHAAASVPSAITYQSSQTVQLPDKEVEIPVQKSYVYTPVQAQVVYGTEPFIAGSQTSVHKPELTAPAIAAPAVFTAKTEHAAPQVTVHETEVTVHETSPNFVSAPFDAGVIEQKASAEIKTVNVPTPVEVAQPVPVAVPYAVPVAQPIKTTSSVSPVVSVDVHSFKTDQTIHPVRYTAHHVASPVVAPAVAPVEYTAHHVVSPVVAQAVAPVEYTAHHVASPVVAPAATSAAAQVGYTAHHVASPVVAPVGYTAHHVASPVGAAAVTSVVAEAVAPVDTSVQQTSYQQSFAQEPVRVQGVPFAAPAAVVQTHQSFAHNLPAQSVVFGQSSGFPDPTKIGFSAAGSNSIPQQFGEYPTASVGWTSSQGTGSSHPQVIPYSAVSQTSGLVRPNLSQATQL